MPPGGVGHRPRRWTRALQEADLPDDTPTAAEAEGLEGMLYRHHGTLYASTTSLQPRRWVAAVALSQT